MKLAKDKKVGKKVQFHEPEDVLRNLRSEREKKKELKRQAEEELAKEEKFQELVETHKYLQGMEKEFKDKIELQNEKEKRLELEAIVMATQEEMEKTWGDIRAMENGGGDLADKIRTWMAEEQARIDKVKAEAEEANMKKIRQQEKQKREAKRLQLDQWEAEGFRQTFRRLRDAKIIDFAAIEKLKVTMKDNRISACKEVAKEIENWQMGEEKKIQDWMQQAEHSKKTRRECKEALAPESGDEGFKLIFRRAMVQVEIFGRIHMPMLLEGEGEKKGCYEPIVQDGKTSERLQRACVESVNRAEGYFVVQYGNAPLYKHSTYVSLYEFSEETQVKTCKVEGETWKLRSFSRFQMEQFEFQERKYEKTTNQGAKKEEKKQEEGTFASWWNGTKDVVTAGKNVFVGL